MRGRGDKKIRISTGIKGGGQKETKRSRNIHKPASLSNFTKNLFQVLQYALHCKGTIGCSMNDYKYFT